MNKLERVFSRGKAFIPFITAGDPDLETTHALVLAMAKAGADLIELGIPFSDPAAEGPVIEAADVRALQANANMDRILQCVSDIRKNCSVPLAFMSYINPIFAYGIDRFFHACNKLSVDAVIIPDVPFEERMEIQTYTTAHKIASISMIAPTSHDRIRMIATHAQGFLYCVSSMGVTGVRKRIATDVSNMIKIAKTQNSIPCAVGFGIGTPEQANAVAQYADGVIVGSAIVKIIAEHGKNSVAPVTDYVRSMKDAIS